MIVVGLSNKTKGKTPKNITPDGEINYHTKDKERIGEKQSGSFDEVFFKSISSQESHFGLHIIYTKNRVPMYHFLILCVVWIYMIRPSGLSLFIHVKCVNKLFPLARHKRLSST